MNNEEKFKNKLREEINRLRNKTEQEIIGLENIDLLKKKKEYDLIPEDKIEEYIDNVYIIYTCYKNINEKLNDDKNTNEKKQLIETSIKKIEETNDMEKEKIKIFKQGLKEFSDTLIYQFSPLGFPLALLIKSLKDENYKITDEEWNKGLLGLPLTLSTLLFIMYCIIAPLEESSTILELYNKNESYRNGLAIMIIPIIGLVLYDMGLLSKKIIDAIIKWKKTKKEVNNSKEILDELGIYNFIIEKQQAEENINSILNKGLVR